MCVDMAATGKLGLDTIPNDISEHHRASHANDYFNSKGYFNAMHVVINAGTTFVIADELGDIRQGSELGFYHEDARFLSRYQLTLDRRRPLPLSAHASDSYSAIHVATNPTLRGAQKGTLSLVRRRLVDGDGLHEDITLTNFGDESATVTLGLELDADFAHIFEVKRALDHGHTLAQRPKTFRSAQGAAGQIFDLSYQHGTDVRRLALHISERPASRRRGAFHFALRLAPRERWCLTLTFHPQVRDLQDVAVRGRINTGPTTDERIRAAKERADAERMATAPLLATDHPVLERMYSQSLRDFAAMRITDTRLCGERGYSIGAGIPWFMTLFGRDSLIATYQALPFFPEAAAGTLRALARLQGRREDPARAEEPGKILHEHRHEHYTEQMQCFFPFPYYGTVDATPLFLMLLAAVYDTTRDLPLVRELLPSALAALEWMETYGDKDGDGYLEYQRESESGLDNQGWKDSWDAIRFRDGGLADPPIALSEVQGYAYAARMGMAGVFEALGEPVRAGALRKAAAALKERFNRDYWMPERRYYALALDGEKRQVDAITSNPGHLLWTGIADMEHATHVAHQLVSPPLFSGWGVRTMATTEGGYNPISYHNGSVWPHDNSLIALGLARYGFTAEAALIANALLRAGEHQADDRLPELYAGYSVEEAPLPIEYLTPNRPQAWATGSVLLLLSTLVGVTSLSESIGTMKTKGAEMLNQPGVAPCFLPGGASRLSVDGLWMHGQQVRIDLERGPNGVRRSISTVATEEPAREAAGVA